MLIACEGNRVGTGIIIDKTTNKPVDSVKYFHIERDPYILYTDSTGKYYVEGPFGGCMRDCLDFEAEFSKKGYKTIKLINPDGDIYLEQE